jgi:hypothetical protein
MNLTIGRRFPGSWRRVKSQYVTLVSGLVMAAAFAAGLGAPRSGDGGLVGADGNSALPAALVALTAVFTVLVLRRAFRSV